MDILDDKQLLEAIDAFLARHSMAPTRFGREVVGEAGFIERLRGGRSVTLKTANRIVEYMKDHDAQLAQSSGSPSPDILPANIGGSETMFHDGEPSGRAPAADSPPFEAAGANTSEGGDAVAHGEVV